MPRSRTLSATFIGTRWSGHGGSSTGAGSRNADGGLPAMLARRRGPA